MAGITPNYGSEITFGSRTFEVQSNDGYIWDQFEGTNPIDVSFDIILDNQTLEEAEEITQTINAISGESYFDFSDESNFFKDMKMSLDNLSIKFDYKNSYSARIAFSQRNEAPDLNLFSKFLKKDFIKLYGTGIQYEDGDVIYDESRASILKGASGHFSFEKGSSRKCFYYCTGTHIASGSITGNVNFIQHTLPIDVEEGFSYEFNSTDFQLGFKSSFDQRIPKSSIKAVSARPASLTFDNLSDKKAKQILHFCEHNAGSRRFELNVPTGIFLGGNVFSVNRWSNRWNYKDSNTVTVSVMRDERFEKFYPVETETVTPSIGLIKNFSAVFTSEGMTVGVGNKITAAKAFSPAGWRTSPAVMTNDTLVMTSGKAYRPNEPAGFNTFAGGFSLSAAPTSYTVAMTLKPVVKANSIYLIGRFSSYLPTIVMDFGANLVKLNDGVDVPTDNIPFTFGQKISVVISYNGQTGQVHSCITNQNGAQTTKTNMGFANIQSFMNFIPIFLGGQTYTGFLHFAGLYEGAMDLNDVKALGQNIISH